MPQSPPADGAVPLDLELLRKWPLPEDRSGDKFSRGTVLLVAGSDATPGAAILAARAALRMGAGRVQIATAPSVVPHVAVAVPESMVIAARDDDGGTAALGEQIPTADCVLVGPGLAAEDVDALVRAVFDLGAAEAVLVVDAAAIPAIERLPEELLTSRAGRIVLTPNRQELAALDAANGDDGMTGLSSVATALGAVVTSFGSVAAPDGRRWHTDVGHPGLGTSGSGDVLTGFVAGVAARTGHADQAACWGTLAHALAGARLGVEREPMGFLAGELIDAVTAALRQPA